MHNKNNNKEIYEAQYCRKTASKRCVLKKQSKIKRQKTIADTKIHITGEWTIISDTLSYAM